MQAGRATDAVGRLVAAMLWGRFRSKVTSYCPDCVSKKVFYFPLWKLHSYWQMCFFVETFPESSHPDWMEQFTVSVLWFMMMSGQAMAPLGK